MSLPELDIRESQLKRLSTTKGATDCEYFRVESFDSMDLFVKRGEKVRAEIENYETLSEALDSRYFLQPVGVIDENTIALPLAEEPEFGFEAVETLWDYPESLPQFLQLQQEVFRGLCHLYKSRNSHSPQNGRSHLFAERVSERISLLEEMKDEILTSSYLSGLSVGDLLYKGVLVEKDGLIIEEASLIDMANQLHEQLTEPYSYRSCLIHADPQVSNILRFEGSTRIIDLSDLKNGEDPAWDIGKWVNYVCRFHNIVKQRNDVSSIDEQTRVLSEETSERLRSDIVQQVSAAVGANPAELARRGILAEFVVNLNTLRRHLVKFPHVATGVIEAIHETFINAKQLNSR